MSVPVRVPHSPRGYVLKRSWSDPNPRWFTGTVPSARHPRQAHIYATAHEAYVALEQNLETCEAVYSLACALEEHARLVGEREGRG